LFPFRNAGRKTVEISKIVPGCSCLVATTDKKSYKPGEKGEVRAIFDIRMFSRPVSKSMQVIAAGRTHVLETNLLIAEILKIEPRVIIWKIGGQQEPKTFRLEVASRNPVNVLKLGCSRDTHFDYRLETIRKGRDYKVHVTPKSLDARVLGALRIDTDYPVPHRSQFIAFLSIRS